MARPRREIRPNMKLFSLAVDKEIDAEVTIMAKREGITKASFYRRAINEYMDRARAENISEAKKRIEMFEGKKSDL